MTSIPVRKESVLLKRRNKVTGAVIGTRSCLSAFAGPALHHVPDWHRPVRSLFGMTITDLIARLAGNYPQLTAKDAEVVPNTVLGAMFAGLVHARRIEIRGFGSFEINDRQARTARNPNSWDKVPVPEKFVPRFKTCRELRERVDS